MLSFQNKKNAFHIEVKEKRNEMRGFESKFLIWIESKKNIIFWKYFNDIR